MVMKQDRKKRKDNGTDRSHNMYSHLEKAWMSIADIWKKSVQVTIAYGGTTESNGKDRAAYTSERIMKHTFAQA